MLCKAFGQIRFSATCKTYSDHYSAGSATFAFYYNYQRPNQPLNNCMPVEEMTNN